MLTKFSKTFSPYLKYTFSTATPSNLDNFVLERRHEYGQAGTIKCDISNINLNIQLQTVWEDYGRFRFYSQNSEAINAIDFEDQNEIYSISDKNAPKCDDQATLVAEIPEYYSFDITNTGDVEFIKGDVSSKMYGNANLNLSNKGSSFKASKIKSEVFNGYINDGKFEVSSYLESANFNFEGNKSYINWKRLGLSGNGLIKLKDAQIQCGSFYCGNNFPGSRGGSRPSQETPQNIIPISNEIKSIHDFIPKLEKEIESDIHSRMEFDTLVGQFGNFQGNSMIYGQNLKLELTNFEANRFLINADQGDLKLSVSRMGSEGVIMLNEGSIEIGIDQESQINIFDMREQTLLNDKGYQHGQPFIFLQLGKDVKLERKVTKKLDVFAKLKEKYNKA